MSDQFSKGIAMDTRPVEQPDGTYPYAKNGVYDARGSAQSEPGFKFQVQVPLGVPMGVIEMDNNEAAIMSVDPGTGISYIWRFNRDMDSIVQTLNDSTWPVKLSFTTNHYITGEFQRNSLNQAIIVFTDKEKFPRFVNMDDTSDIHSATDTLLFLQASAPSLTAAIDVGGVLDKGAYFVYAKYSKIDGSETGYIASTGPFFATSQDASTITTASLRITATNLDLSFEEIIFAIVSRVDGAFKAVELESLPVSANGVTLIYTGANNQTEITLEEVLTPAPVYVKVGTIGQLSDSLYLGDLESLPLIDMTSFAAMVKVRVKSELVSIIPIDPDVKSGKKRSLMHQEVYGLYIRYKLSSGGTTKWFHVPGNTPQPADTAIITGTTATRWATPPKKFQVEDTCKNINASDKTCDTGIWVNQNELYPDIPDWDLTSLGGPNLRGLPVRHHRMPSLAFCNSTYYNSPLYGKTQLDLLGLVVSNVIIPPQFVDKISGYEIGIAKRSIIDSTVLGQAPYLLAAQQTTLNNTDLEWVSTGGNWDSTAVNRKNKDDQGDVNGAQTIRVSGSKQNRLRFHAFDMLFSQPAMSGVLYISPQLKMQVNNLKVEYPTGGFIEDGEILNYKVPVIYLIDYAGKDAVAPTIPSATIRQGYPLGDPKYIQANVNEGKWKNIQLELAFVGDITKGTGGDTLPPFAAIDLNTFNRTQYMRPAQRINHEETYLTNLMAIKQDLYNSFMSQPIIASGSVRDPSAPATIIYVGDTFLNEYSFHTYGYTDFENAPGNGAAEPDKCGIKVARRVICEAVSNINQRFEDSGNIYSRWWPHNALVAQPTLLDSNYLVAFDRNKDPNQFGYSKDLNAVNDLDNAGVFDPTIPDQSLHPYRVHRGGKLPRQGKQRSWRTFLPLDYYEMQKNLGRVVRIVGKDDRLLVHMANALLITQDKARLDSAPIAVTLGTGDIFQFPPVDAMSSKQGYAGTRHDLAAIDTPIGYIFLDARQGQMFWFKGQLKLMNNAINQFLRKWLKQSLADGDNNPFIGNGITVGYDPDYKRILLTVKNQKLLLSIDQLVPNYEPTMDFYTSLVPGQSIVYKDGRYQLFMGLNNPITSGYDCATITDPLAQDGITSIREDTPAGAQVFQVLATDPNNLMLTYYIIGGNTNSAFSISPVGKITVNNTAQLNYDLQTSFALQVRVSNSAGGTAVCIITIGLQNNTLPILATSSLAASIIETAGINTPVLTVVGMGQNGHAIAYSLAAPGMPFSMDPVTGVIKTTGPLSFELASQYQMVATLSDTFVTATVNITITVVNSPSAPVGVDTTVPVYYESISNGDALTSVVVNDSDTSFSFLTIEWLNPSSLFSYDTASGDIILLDKASLVMNHNYVLNFRVTDPDGGTDDFSVTIQVWTTFIRFEKGAYHCIGATCPGGYTLAPDESYCYQVNTVSATPPSIGSKAIVAKTNSVYSQYGSLIYNPGFNSNGSGAFEVIDTSGSWWRNIPSDNSHGPLNRCGVWAFQGSPDLTPGQDEPFSEWIGVAKKITLTVAKTYYIAIAGDNKVRVKVNDNIIIQQDPVQVALNYDSHYGMFPGTTGVDVTFKAWHIYPIPLAAGPNYVVIEGWNDVSIGAFGAEIYDNTKDQLKAATQYSDLNVIFSTKDTVGLNMQSGSTIGYSCSAGYALEFIPASTYNCNQVVVFPITPGYTKRVDTVNVFWTTPEPDVLIASPANAPAQTFMGQAQPYYADEINSPDCGFL